MKSLTEEVDDYGMPLQSIGEAAPVHMWYMVVPKGDEQEVLTHGLKPIHKHEYVYLNLDDAEEHAKFLNKHLDHPQAIVGIDASQVKLKHAKNANYMKGEEDRVDVGAIGKVPAQHIHHVKDVGKLRRQVKEPETKKCAKQNRGLPPKEDFDHFGSLITEAIYTDEERKEKNRLEKELHDLGQGLSKLSPEDQKKVRLQKDEINKALDVLWDKAKARGVKEDVDSFGLPIIEREYWGRGGAGGVFYAEDTGRYLFAHRSEDVLEPGTWGVWGGKFDDDETPEETLKREIEEEAGYTGEYKLKPLFVFKDGDFSFHNYLIIVPHEFEPIQSWETQGHLWTTLDKIPTPMHFGLKALLPHLKQVKEHGAGGASLMYKDREKNYKTLQGEARTKMMKVNGQEVEAVLMAGGPGFKIYSALDGVVLVAGRKQLFVKESDEKYKPIMRYVNLRYQPISEHEAIKKEFEAVLHSMGESMNESVTAEAIAKAKEEVSSTPEAELEKSAADSWAARAIACFQLAKEQADRKDYWVDRGDDMYHEALEHSALSKDPEALKEVLRQVEAEREGLGYDEDMPEDVDSFGIPLEERKRCKKNDSRPECNRPVGWFYPGVFVGSRGRRGGRGGGGGFHGGGGGFHGGGGMGGGGHGGR
jgi:8-oxo-dGTP pyrophosphatase MutT (NUDIX family)